MLCTHIHMRAWKHVCLHTCTPPPPPTHTRTHACMHPYPTTCALCFSLYPCLIKYQGHHLPFILVRLTCIESLSVIKYQGHHLPFTLVRLTCIESLSVIKYQGHHLPFILVRLTCIEYKCCLTGTFAPTHVPKWC